MKLSIVSPAYNEADNLPELYQGLAAALKDLDMEWEWVVVDDHSSDATYAVLQDLARSHPEVRGVRLARNAGSHTAVLCGINQAEGDAAVVMAADMQDPPEVIADMISAWQEGNQIVWAVRDYGKTAVRQSLFSRLYYWVMRHIVGLRDMPESGADYFLVDRAVMSALNQFKEIHVSIFALLSWMGYRQGYVSYAKQDRIHGRSGWTLRKKIQLLIDSVTAFSYFPIHAMSAVGFVIACIGFIYMGVVLINALMGRAPPGWSATMMVLLVIGGVQMIMMGILGEYLWRTLDETRRRPRFLIESKTPRDGETSL